MAVNFTEWLLGSNPNGGSSNLLGLLGAGAKMYGDYQSQKMAQKQYALQKQAFDFNKMLSQREINRQNTAQNALNQAWSNSMLNPLKRKQDEGLENGVF